MSEEPSKKEKTKNNRSSAKDSYSDGIISGWLLISGLCIIAFLLDVPIGIIIVAIIGYAISSK